MGILKAVTVVMAWILLSFFWVSHGQSAEIRCSNYGQVDSWLEPYPVLRNWYHFYVDRQDCEANAEEFFKALASSEQLSIKLNEVRITFDQFYVPIYDVLEMTDWQKILQDDFQNIQSDLSLIDHSLRRAMGNMKAADQDYFRAVVLLDLPRDFV